MITCTCKNKSICSYYTNTSTINGLTFFKLLSQCFFVSGMFLNLIIYEVAMTIKPIQIDKRVSRIEKIVLIYERIN